MSKEIEDIIHQAVRSAISEIIKPTPKEASDEEKIAAYSRQTRIKYAKKHSK